MSIKNYIHLAVATIVAAVTLVSCELEFSQCDMAGNWQLHTIDTLSTNGTLSLAERPRYWAFEGNLLVVGGYNGYVMHISRNDSQLQIEDLYRIDHNADDPVVSDITPLRPYGINEMNETIVIERHTGSSLTLRTGTLRLYFRKF